MILLKNKKKNDGSALIVTLCVLAFLMALSAALLVSTHSVVNNNRKYVDTIQCKLLNRTLSESVNTQIETSNPNSLGIEIKKKIENASDKLIEKNYTLTDNTTGAVHNVNVYNKVRGASNYDLFVNIKTEYNGEIYSQSSRFISVKEGSEYHWVLASVENLTTGGS